MIVTLLFVAFLALMFLGVPIGAALGLAGVGLAVTAGGRTAMGLAVASSAPIAWRSGRTGR